MGSAGRLHVVVKKALQNAAQEDESREGRQGGDRSGPAPSRSRTHASGCTPVSMSPRTRTAS